MEGGWNAMHNVSTNVCSVDSHVFFLRSQTHWIWWWTQRAFVSLRWLIWKENASIGTLILNKGTPFNMLDLQHILLLLFFLLSANSRYMICYFCACCYWYISSTTVTDWSTAAIDFHFYTYIYNLMSICVDMTIIHSFRQLVPRPLPLTRRWQSSYKHVI